ncbi:unnamed protein product, partial [Rodentolepis nana]|uniref:Integrase catalytic domain-containing protein n=1 Tax=Rodentolepis nana TaxID=102285 RepID=A0A0R3T4E9_RODNA
MDAEAIFDDRPRADNLPHLLSGINMEYIGETHQALEQELDYQTYLEDELKNYVARGLYSQHDAVNLQTLININREHLESLSPITSLEHMFSEISQKVSDRAVDLANARDSQAFWDRNLSKNMRACWKTVQRFAYVSRVHISNASEYQMFYYNCDHFIKSLQKKAEINYNRYRDIDTDYPSVSTSRLNTFMTEGLAKFQSLASEVMRLMDKAQRVNPVYLRVRGLNRPVSGIMLCDYTTKNFSLRAGQHVFVLNNAYVTPLTSNSDATEGSETSECSTCSYCCGLHHSHHPGCENYEVQMSTTVTETTPTEEGTDSADLAQGAPVVMRRRQLSDVSSVTEETNGPSEESTVNSTPGCSHTFCSQREPVIWKVRTSDGSLTVDVPAVTVMINERDEEAIAHAHEIYEFFTNMWREAIDIWLTKGVKALTNYFSTLIEAKYIRLESERIFQQFLDEVQRAFPIQDPESASANKILNEMIETLREKIRRQETREETTEEIYVRITEVATYRKTVQKVRDHVNHIRRFMKDVEENTHRGYIDTATLKSMGDLKYVYEETVEEHRKLERMLRQVNAFRTGRRSPRVPVHTIQSFYGKYYSSAEEYSSESEESQYDVERSKDLSTRILYGREETHRTTALTDRPRYVRRPRGGVAGGELPTDSSDESDTGKPRRSSGFLYKPTHGRRDEHVSEIIEETNDTVISSMTLDRKINFAKQIRRPDEIDISPDERYRSRRQYHVPPGPQKGDVSMVYLQITTAKSTQDPMSPTDDNRQSRGIQIDIETIPVDGKDVLQVEPRVASWQKNAAGGMTLRHDVSLDPIQLERERRPGPERTMEAIVVGTARTDDYHDRGVQVTSRDEYKGIMKPPMYEYVQRSTQTAAYVEPIEVIQIDKTEMVHAAPPIPENRYIVSSFTEVPKVTSGLISSSLILGQTDTAITAPRSEISTTISTVTHDTVKEFIPSAIGVSTEQLLHSEDAWTEAAIVEEIQVPTIQQIRKVGEKSAPPIESVHQIVKVRACQTSKPLFNDFEVQTRIDTQRIESITSTIEEPSREVITSSEIKNVEFTITAGSEQVLHTEQPVLERAELVSVTTSWTETPRVLGEISSDWIADIADRGISAPEIAVESTVTSSQKTPEPRITQINVNTQTESEYISRGTVTMVVEEMMPPIRVVEAPRVQAAPLVEPRVSIRYCQTSTPLHIHYEGITTIEEARTRVSESKPRMHSIELQAQIAAESLEAITHANEEERRQLKGIGINTEDLKTYLDAWTEAFVVDEPQKLIVQEHTMEVKAELGPKRVTHSMETQTLFRGEMTILSVECPSIVSVSTASMTDCTIEQVQPTEIHRIRQLIPEFGTVTTTSEAPRLEEVGTSTDSMMTYLDTWTETTAIEEPSPKPRMHSMQVQAQIGTDVQETTTYTTSEKQHQLERISINTKDLITHSEAWTEALAMVEPEKLIYQVQTEEVKAQPVVKKRMDSREIQASMMSERIDTTTQVSELSKRMDVVNVETPVIEYRATAIMTKSMIEPTQQVVVHAFAPAKPLEIASTGLDIGQTDTQTDVHSEGLLTTVSSVVELPIRQSEVTIGAEVKYSDAQTTAEAEELKTLVSSWAEEVIIRTIPAPVVEAPPPLPMTPILTS